MVRQKNDLLTRHGVDRTLLNFFKLPYLFETVHYFHKYHLGPLMALGIPFIFFSITMKKFYHFLAAFVFFNLVFWFSSSQIMRYLMPTLPFVAIFSAYPIGRLLNPLFSYQLFQQQYIKGFVAIALLGYGAYSIFKEYNFLHHSKPVPISDSGWRKSNLKQNEYYSFVIDLNNRQAKRVFNVSNAMIENTFNGQVLGDWFGIANRRLIFNNSKTVEEIAKVLKKFDTKYLLVGKKQKWYNKINQIIKPNQQDITIIRETDDAILYFFKGNSLDT